MSEPRAELAVMRGLVRVEVKGFKDERPSDLPRVRIDNGLVRDLLEWMSEHEIYAIHTPHCGGGVFLGYFEEADGERVVAFLEGQCDDVS